MKEIRHFLEPKDLKLQEYEELFELVDKIMANPKDYSEIARGKILAALFFEPSTRTRLSFESAMLKLGGSVIGFSEASSSSTAKGESIEDTTRMASIYGDIIAMRHPEAYSPCKASKVSTIPVINAGDGGHQHPTQTLADLITIRSKFNRLNNLKIGFCGDLKFGRTVHSLAQAFSEYKNNSFVFISPDELRMPDYVKQELENKDMPYIETDNLEEAIADLDIIYMTRVQKERFEDEAEYERLKDFYILDGEKMAKAKVECIVLHPLPRVNEISCEVDNDPRAWYFKQAEYGMYGRMALIIKLLQLDSENILRLKYYELEGV